MILFKSYSVSLAAQNFRHVVTPITLTNLGEDVDSYNISPSYFRLIAVGGQEVSV